MKRDKDSDDRLAYAIAAFLIAVAEQDEVQDASTKDEATKMQQLSFQGPSGSRRVREVLSGSEKPHTTRRNHRRAIGATGLVGTSGTKRRDRRVNEGS